MRHPEKARALLSHLLKLFLLMQETGEGKTELSICRRKGQKKGKRCPWEARQRAQGLGDYPFLAEGAERRTKDNNKREERKMGEKVKEPLSLLRSYDIRRVRPERNGIQE